MPPAVEPPFPSDARRPRVFVTGGRGGIGRHVVKQLAGAGWSVTALSRRLHPDTPGITAIQHDLRAGGKDEWAAILRGHDALVHCAFLNDDLTGEANGRLADAAAAAGLGRFVHLSTTSVYPTVASGTLDETWPYADPPPDVYTATKIAIERAILARRTQIHVTVLQPTNVIDPAGGWWTTGVLDLMRSGRMMLINGGAGTANLVKVEDVAWAAVRALETHHDSGQRFILTDGHAHRWGTYLKRLEAQTGRPSLQTIDADAAKKLSAKLYARSLGALWLSFVRRITRERPLFPMNDLTIDRFASEARFSPALAQRVLGFQPESALT